MKLVTIVIAATAAAWTMGIDTAGAASLGPTFGFAATSNVFAVTKTADTNDGACDADCSLREAVIAANNHSGTDTIEVPAGTYSLAIPGTGEWDSATGDLNVADSVTIEGAGVSDTIVDGAMLDDVMTVCCGSATLRDLTIEHGAGPAYAISQTTPLALTLLRVAVRDSVGGGVSSDGPLTLTDVTVSGNTGNDAVAATSTSMLTNVTVSGNVAPPGINGSGAIQNYGTMALTNVTVSGNTNGGIANNWAGRLTMTNATISGNIGYIGAEPLAFYNADGNVSANVVNSILDGRCEGVIAPFFHDFVSLGHNIDSGSSCFLSGPSDLSNTDPMLLPLAANGGLTQTHALAGGSPAIDVGDNGACPATDQRGVARPQGVGCDIGAYELNASANHKPTCSDYSGSVAPGATLHDSVNCTDSDSGDSVVVTVVSSPGNGHLSLNPSGTFTYLPDSGFAGTDTFTFDATDSHGATSSFATATITVPNDSPNCVDYKGSVAPGATFTDGVACIDPNLGDSVTIEAVSQPAHGTLTFATSGRFVYKPNSGFLGTDSFTFQATDSYGALSNVATATVNVAFQPPTCSPFTDAVHSGPHVFVYVVVPPWTCPDPAGDSITLAVVSPPSHGTADPLTTGTRAGGIEYSPNTNFVGVDTFTFRAVNSHGVASNVVTATIAVEDQAPSCGAFASGIHAGQHSLVYVVIPPNVCSDADGDPFTLSVVSPPSNGSAQPLTTGTLAGGVEYSPNTNFVGTDSFTFRATDSIGLTSNVVTATISVVDQAPACVNFGGSVQSGQHSFVYLDVPPSICSDADGDPFTLSVVSPPSNGTAQPLTTGTLAGGIYYSPNTNFVGTDSFMFRATDSIGLTSTIVTASILVYNTPTGANVSVQPDPSVSLTFVGGVTAPGITTATSSTTGPTPPPNFQLAGLYWEISTTATYVPPIHVCLAIPTGVTSPQIIHYVSGSPVFVPTTIVGGASCGDVSSLSPFFLVQPLFTAHFLQPLAQSIDPAKPVVNMDKNGRTIPVKVELSSSSAAITGANATGPVKIGLSKLASCTNAANGVPLSSVAEAGRSNGNSNQFRFDSSSQSWIYNLDTKALGLVSGICYRIDVAVNGTRVTNAFAVFEPAK